MSSVYLVFRRCPTQFPGFDIRTGCTSDFWRRMTPASSRRSVKCSLWWRNLDRCVCVCVCVRSPHQTDVLHLHFLELNKEQQYCSFVCMVSTPSPLVLSCIVTPHPQDTSGEASDQLTSSAGKRPLEDISTDLEDVGRKRPAMGPRPPLVTRHTPGPSTLMFSSSSSQPSQSQRDSWREVLGPPPPRGTSRVSFL